MKRVISVIALTFVLVACQAPSEVEQLNDTFIETIGKPFDTIFVELDEAERQLATGQWTTSQFVEEMKDLVERAEQPVEYVTHEVESVKSEEANTLLAAARHNATVKRDYVLAIYHYVVALDEAETNDVAEDELQLLIEDASVSIETLREAIIDSDDEMQRLSTAVAVE